jgi:hypothetical protein
MRGGWGKIDAAASARYAISRWHPSLIANLRTCACIVGQIERFELVLAERTVVYDTATLTYFPRPQQRGCHDVLISHAQDERDLAGAWKESLTSISDGAINVWYSSDLAPDGGLRAGFEWLDELGRRIAESQAITVIQTASVQTARGSGGSAAWRAVF